MAYRNGKLRASLAADVKRDTDNSDGQDEDTTSDTPKTFVATLTRCGVKYLCLFLLPNLTSYCKENFDALRIHIL